MRLVIRKPAQCRAKTDAPAADQRGSEYLGGVILECSGKAGGDLAAAEYRPRGALAIRRVLIGDQFALTRASLDGIGTNRPEIGIAAQNRAIPCDNHAAGPALYAVAHLDMNRVQAVLHVRYDRRKAIRSVQLEVRRKNNSCVAMRSLKETILKLQTGGFNKEKRC